MLDDAEEVWDEAAADVASASTASPSVPAPALVAMRVSHLTANTRDDLGTRSGRDKHFYDSKELILELHSKDVLKGKQVFSRKKVCALRKLGGGGKSTPVNMECLIPRGQSVRMKVFIGVERDGRVCEEYAASTVTLSNSGVISCQLAAAGIICNVHFCIELVTATQSSEACQENNSATMKPYKHFLILEQIQHFLCSKFWTLYIIFFLLLFLVQLANHAAISRVAAGAVQGPGRAALRLRAGDTLRGGEHMAGCFPGGDAASTSDCTPAVLALHSKLNCLPLNACIYLYL
jgi:hypothetical protein